MSGKDRSRQTVQSFVNELEQGTASLTDEELARLERMIVERRGRAAAHMVVAPIDTTQPCNPQSCSSKSSFDARVYIERNDEGRMDLERGQLESPSAGTGLETPGQQCLPNLEMRRTIVDGCLLVGASLNLGGNVFPREELGIGMQIDSQTSFTSSKNAFLQMNHKSIDMETASKENKQFDPGEKGGEPPL